MRVLMLGWEFPPFITGGLGTACYGLTRALSRRGVTITFVLPRAVNTRVSQTHVKLLSPTPPGARHGDVADGQDAEAFTNVTFKSIPSPIISPYAAPPWAAHRQGGAARLADSVLDPAEPEYGGDLLAAAERYANLCRAMVRLEAFDVIHAHDWLTFPAGTAIANESGKPLVAHVHSTEYDRAGDRSHQPLVDIERRGMRAATRVVAVSRFTRDLIESRYGIPGTKIDVVYNGVGRDDDPAPASIPSAGRIRADEKIVLFLGRLTAQKGPETFLAAAKRVLEKIDKVKFIVAGSGDLAAPMIEQAAAAGIGSKVLFTGFLRGEDVQRVYRMADVYVMPSVSEPFGIAALEAARHDVPVIVSRSSGVSEVLKHALKVDAWDVNQIAEKIIAVLTRPPLAEELRHQADIETRLLTWDDAANRCLHVYDTAMRAHTSGQGAT